MRRQAKMQAFQDILERFELLDNWEQRYQYLVELGAQLPPLPERFRTEAHRVKGCMSTVHIGADWDPERADHIRFHGDCDTAIIEGVLALLVECLSGHSADEIEAADVDAFFQQLGLFEHLSPTRHFGIYAIVELMKSQARALAVAPGQD
jgi:cysteine desulfuration protein SufE